MSEPTYDEHLKEFRELVEEKIGQAIHPDTDMGDGICWFFLDVPLELNGETFDAEVDFDLSEAEVKPMYAEIYVEQGSEREKILAEVGTRLEVGDNECLYEYYLEKDEVGGVMADLQVVHAEVYD